MNYIKPLHYDKTNHTVLIHKLITQFQPQPEDSDYFIFKFYKHIFLCILVYV